MADYEDSIFDNLPPRKRRAGDGNTYSRFREAMGLYQPEGPLPPRPPERRSGKGGPSIGQSGTGPVVASVWSASDAAATGMTLSNGGLTVANTSSKAQTIRNTISHTSGKFYIEFLCNAQPATYDEWFGLASFGFAPTVALGTADYSVGLQYGGNNFTAGFTVYYNSTGYAQVNDVIMLAVDFDAGKVWIGKNNVWMNDPVAETSPIATFVPPTVGALFVGLTLPTVGDTFTLQATAASQKYAPPSGFVAWDGAGAHSAQATAYLARTVGGNEGGNGANIATLIDGLVADGVWSKLDCLYVLAQQNATDAKLNLVGTGYSLNSLGLLRSATFTSYVGFSNFSAAVYLDTQFNPATAPGPHYIQNSASFGVWSVAIAGETAAQMGNGATGASGESLIYNDYANTFYARVNEPTAGGSATPGTGGLFTGDRSSASAVIPYWAGIAQPSQSSTSQPPISSSFTIGKASPGSGTGQTLSAAFIGASLGAAGQLALYNRLRTYMTAVGVP